MQATATILEIADTHLREWFAQQMPASFVFHNFHHAEDVAKMVGKLGKKEKLPAEQVEILSLAAWFSFTGLAEGENDDFQKASASRATAFLNKHSYPTERTQRVFDLILMVKGKLMK